MVLYLIMPIVLQAKEQAIRWSWSQIFHIQDWRAQRKLLWCTGRWKWHHQSPSDTKRLWNILSAVWWWIIQHNKRQNAHHINGNHGKRRSWNSSCSVTCRCMLQLHESCNWSFRWAEKRFWQLLYLCIWIWSASVHLQRNHPTEIKQIHMPCKWHMVLNVLFFSKSVLQYFQKYVQSFLWKGCCNERDWWKKWSCQEYMQYRSEILLFHQGMRIQRSAGWKWSGLRAEWMNISSFLSVSYWVPFPDYSIKDDPFTEQMKIMIL